MKDILEQIKTAKSDNIKDMKNYGCDDSEELSYCEGFDQALEFVLSLLE